MNIINTLDLHTVNFINGQKGSYRVVVKCPAGFYVIREIQSDEMTSPTEMLSWYKKGSLASIEFKAERGEYWLTVFAMKGKKCMVIDEDILKDLTVGTINQYFIDTNLYSQRQYMAVGAKTWADKAFTLGSSLVHDGLGFGTSVAMN
jgi:hypothetical protein